MVGRTWSVIYVVNPTLTGFFRLDKDSQSGFFAVHTIGDTSKPEASNAAADVSEAKLIELLRGGVGIPDYPVKIDGVARWRSVSDIARHYQLGRVFIAGDAAHVMPPNGGFGGNTGIHDAHNLAWKVALVLKGIAAPELLATYEQERRPAGKFTVEQAYHALCHTLCDLPRRQGFRAASQRFQHRARLSLPLASDRGRG